MVWHRIKTQLTRMAGGNGRCAICDCCLFVHRVKILVNELRAWVVRGEGKVSKARKEKETGEVSGMWYKSNAV